ncbi:uncharacterized protein LOC113765759 [Coffea eugenioides]|uniref:uncharacterized protein LOC113765759 n=1 Tax=Coffea eugenioides TaxID=49369 RepID=UPI000F613DD1|nr:uncharacterized protein LOC113765759 [Coffea eugenioides]
MSTVAARSATAAIGAGQKNMMGGALNPIIPPATTVKVEDPYVIEIAEFAVAKIPGLVFIKVEFGFWWKIETPNLNAGTYYMLAIKTQDNNRTRCDVALVCDLPGINGHTLIWYNDKNN